MMGFHSEQRAGWDLNRHGFLLVYDLYLIQFVNEKAKVNLFTNCLESSPRNQGAPGVNTHPRLAPAKLKPCKLPVHEPRIKRECTTRKIAHVKTADARHHRHRLTIPLVVLFVNQAALHEKAPLVVEKFADVVGPPRERYARHFDVYGCHGL